MEPYFYWLIAAIVLVLIEIFTAGFAVICFAIGALAAAIVAACGAGINWQLAAMIAVTFAAFVFVRPFALRLLNKKKDELPTNADALVGRKAIVSETIDVDQNTGRVAIDGDDWKAVSASGERIEKGTRVEIVSRDSIILTVK